ncbi:MAG: OmpA family [Pseudomonadota bacterium]|jgi:outer membrane protein OmpA-like peptidoglycan-associated protein
MLRTRGSLVAATTTAVLLLGACSANKVAPGPPTPEEIAADKGVNVVEYEKKTQELVSATRKLEETRNSLDEQRRRLTVICADYPEHHVCAPQTAATYAREAFCKDANFKEHVDGIVKSCHQGQCKQVDDANLLTRSQYMLLVQRLPHKLITFRVGESKLDGEDRKQLQQFLEAISAEKGYIIVVGRASRDGSWKTNLRLAVDRANVARDYLVEQLGMDAQRVGYITYGHEKMYLTDLDVERLSGGKKLSVRDANRSALIFAYPCYVKP